jgi:hypothetical protein
MRVYATPILSETCPLLFPDSLVCAQIVGTKSHCGEKIYFLDQIVFSGLVSKDAACVSKLLKRFAPAWLSLFHVSGKCARFASDDSCVCDGGGGKYRVSISRVSPAAAPAKDLWGAEIRDA